MAVKKLTWMFTKRIWSFLAAVVFFSCICGTYCEEIKPTESQDNDQMFWPTVLIATLVRNKAHTLPWFFGLLENLDYPKDRMAIWIKSDHNSDNSTAIIEEWVKATEHMYNSVEFVYRNKETAYHGEKGPCHWTDERFENMIKMREEALNAARLMWADFLFMVDADVMLENPKVLKILIEQEKTIVAPMMQPSIGDAYSNFWGGMDENGYYQRVPEYFEILEREKIGIFQVPMVHTVFLIDMRQQITEKLSYIAPEGYKKAEDDIIIFAICAAKIGLPMYVTNTEDFGHIMIPLDEYHFLYVEQEQFDYMRINALDAANPDMGPGVDYIVEDRGLRQSPFVHVPLPPKTKLDFDQVYMINLERRPERHKRMLYVFDILGIKSVLTPAVDGQHLNASYLQKLGLNILPGFEDPYKGRLLNDTYLYKDLKIQVVPGFTDPYGGRPMTMGEIGCFLSHYFIWKDVVEKNYKSVVVFEDDLKFEPYFKTKLRSIMHKVASKVPDWDLIYLGRKRLNRQDEAYLEGVNSLVWPSYSYWTLSYLLSQRGARKLLAQEPLQNLLPVDEYLPVMFNKHPEESWKEPFSPRDLIALSAEPLLIYPTHYLGEPNYISDTEYSTLITESTDGANIQNALNSHNSAETPQGPPVSKHSEFSSGLPGNNIDPASSPQQPEDIYRDEL